ncbi:serine hydrolase [Duganella aceris]|uniref:Serine hydrolase n=1 Tax=Duganella aceris TaxID=2703883 RepID=A0ABX0FKW8_9BURK|nr:serine hydrolase [Duganella aceris]NGZ85225.1 serine hydrolase [Duganella aceris]
MTAGHQPDPPPFDSSGFDAIVGRFMQAFELPGVALAVAGPNGRAYVRGYGVRELGRPALVDVETSFAIASTSKAFLAACLAMLVDDGKLAWEDPVRRHLPEFELHDPAASEMMTVRDLLLHNSGLPLGAADLMQFPRSDHRLEEILAALRHFPLGARFRSGYAYDNCLYLVAGMLLERVAGLSWDDFVAQRVFAPLGMAGAVANPTLVTGANRAGRHARLGPPIIGMGALELVTPDESALIGPAGGINCGAAALLSWLQVQLGRGALADGRRLWSEAQADQMWAPRTLISCGPGPTAGQPQRSVLQAYALGWGVSDYRGRRMITHGGALAGQTSRVTLLPEQGIGFALLSNSGDAEPLSGLRYALLDYLLNVPCHDWLDASRNAIASAQAQVFALVGQGDFVAPVGGPGLPLSSYAGRYRDAWYGEVEVGCDEGGLSIAFSRTSALRGRLESFGTDCFRTRFARGAAEDAVVQFHLAEGAVSHVTLRALSPLADFSFDYHDLLLMPVAVVAGGAR